MNGENYKPFGKCLSSYNFHLFDLEVANHQLCCSADFFQTAHQLSKQKDCFSKRRRIKVVLDERNFSATMVMFST